MDCFKYLALGDSYTVGEQVLLSHSFPYQVIQKMRKQNLAPGKHISFCAPEIVAKTGWTTDELSAGILSCVFDSSGYDLVSLLIGVNNQYRGRSKEEYSQQFAELLQKAIHFARGNNENVFVLSIPDWGVTPFAADRNADEIAQQIDEFNVIAKTIAEERGCRFIDITTEQRRYGMESEFLAPDGLHPSEKEYNKWADQLVCSISLRF